MNPRELATLILALLLLLLAAYVCSNAGTQISRERARQQEQLRQWRDDHGDIWDRARAAVHAPSPTPQHGSLVIVP